MKINLFLFISGLILFITACGSDSTNTSFSHSEVPQKYSIYSYAFDAKNNLYIGNGNKYYRVESKYIGKNIPANFKTMHCNSGSIFICAEASSSGIFITRDLITWKQVGPSNVDIDDLALNDNYVIGVGSEGAIVTYAIKSNSVTTQKIGRNNLRSIDNYGQSNTFFAVGDNGTVLESHNGLDWYSTAPNNLTANLRSITYTDNGPVVAVGDKGVIISSFDHGDSWIIEPSVVNYDLNTILNTKNQYYVGGSKNTMLKSYDGINWSVVDLPNYPVNNQPYSIASISYTQDKSTEKSLYIAVIKTEEEQIIQYNLISNDGITWSFDTIQQKGEDQTKNLVSKIDIQATITAVGEVIKHPSNAAAWETIIINIIKGAFIVWGWISQIL